MKGRGSEPAAPIGRRRASEGTMGLAPIACCRSRRVALLVALGGTSYAAVLLPANSVGTAQLKSDAVVSSKVKDGSLLAIDFKSGQLPSGPAGPAGSAGPAGPRRRRGPQVRRSDRARRSTGPGRAVGPDRYPHVRLREHPRGNAVLACDEREATCPAGQHAVSGGFDAPSSGEEQSSQRWRGHRHRRKQRVVGCNHHDVRDDRVRDLLVQRHRHRAVAIR